MNGRRQFFRTIGLGFLLAGGTTAATSEELVLTAKPQPTSSPPMPEQRPQYKLFGVRAGDSVERPRESTTRRDGANHEWSS